MFGCPTYMYGYPAPGNPPPSGPGMPPPGTYGGISFDVTPPDARVLVDSQFVGTEALSRRRISRSRLTPGRHHIELEAPGMAPIAFDVDILPGEGVPYLVLQPG